MPGVMIWRTLPMSCNTMIPWPRWKQAKIDSAEVFTARSPAVFIGDQICEPMMWKRQALA